MARPFLHMHKEITVRKMLSVQVTEVSVHDVLDCSFVMQWMEVVKVRVECGLSIFLILVNNLSSAELQRYSNVCTLDIPANVHRSDRALRRRTALILCRSTEVAKPHHAGAA